MIQLRAVPGQSRQNVYSVCWACSLQLVRRSHYGPRPERQKFSRCQSSSERRGTRIRDGQEGVQMIHNQQTGRYKLRAELKHNGASSFHKEKASKRLSAAKIVQYPANAPNIPASPLVSYSGRSSITYQTAKLSYGNTRLLSTSVNNAAPVAVVAAVSAENRSINKVVESPNIRKTLARLQKDFDNASQEQRTALGIAFSQLTHLARESNIQSDAEDDNDSGLTLVGDLSDDGTSIHDNNFATRIVPNPGDLIELHLEGRYIVGVVSNVFGSGKDRQDQIVTSGGSWVHKTWTGTSSLSYVYRNFVSSKEIEQLRPYLPDRALESRMLNNITSFNQHISPEVARPVTDRIHEFEKRVDILWRTHASKIDNAFSLLAKPQGSRWSTLEEITRETLGLGRIEAVPQEALYVMHRACFHYNFGFIPRNDGRSSIFEILSKRDSEIIDQVRKWAREHNDLSVRRLTDSNIKSGSTLEYFADEIRPVIEESRRNRDKYEGGWLGPSKTQLTGINESGVSFEVREGKKLTSAAQVILKFLVLWTSRLWISQAAESVVALGWAVMKVVGYSATVQHSSPRVAILRECGVLMPWEPVYSLKPHLTTPSSGWNESLSKKLVDAKEELAGRPFDEDAMQDYRYDFGDMPCICIDSAGTVQIDDGISLEATSDMDTYWIHAHIANPTAFIPQNSQTNTYAKAVGSTLYLPQSFEPMIPSRATQERLSIRPNGQSLTISTKLTLDGVVLDRQIRNGIVRNVIRVTPEVVDRYVGGMRNLGESLEQRIDTIGRHAQAISTLPNGVNSLDKVIVDQLCIIKRLTCNWRNRLYAERGRLWSKTLPNTASVRVDHIESNPCLFKHYRQFIGDPGITLTTYPSVPNLRNTISTRQPENLLANAMILANNSAAVWCHERGVPVIFRGGTAPYDNDLLNMIAAKSEQDLTIAEQLDLSKTVRGHFAERPEVRSTRMLPHPLLGFDGYAQVTSPLRRSGDMLNHYQIEAALRQEAKLGRRLTSNDNTDFPYPEQVLQRDMPFIVDLDGIVMRRYHKAFSHWSSQFFLRAVHYNECPGFPREFTGYLVDVAEDTCQVQISELGLWTKVSNSVFGHLSSTQDRKVGDVYKFRFDKETLAFHAVERIA